MKDFYYRHQLGIGLIAVVVGGTLAMVGLAVGLAWACGTIHVETMRSLGYEAKRVNLECYAKYHDRWLNCSAVANNQIQVVD